MPHSTEMIESGLVYIHSEPTPSGFVGCGALIEGPFIITCRHVWDTAQNASPDGEVHIYFPAPRGEGKKEYRPARLADPCDADEEPLDLVILTAEVPPANTPLSLTHDPKTEYGRGYALAGLQRPGPSGSTLHEVTINGEIAARIGNNRFRQFTGDASEAYWLDYGSSGSPICVHGRSELAAMVIASETGERSGEAKKQVAFILPASTIHRYLRFHVGREICRAQNIEEARVPKILENLGAADISIAELRRRLAGRIAEIEAEVQDRLNQLKSSGLIQQAEKQGISEAAIRNTVQRLGGENIAPENLVPWLEAWIDSAVHELSRKTNEGEAYDAAFNEAQRRFQAGHVAEAAEAFMEEFRRQEQREAERQQEYVHSQAALLEGAIRFHALALDEPAIITKLHRLAALHAIQGQAALGKWLFNKAPEHSETGDQKGSNPDLLIAIAAYRAALQESPRARVPLAWAVTQNNLGNALATLGQRETSTARLEEAVNAYLADLEEYTRDRVPRDWAMTQNNLGNVLLRLGQRETGTARLQEAVNAYQAALEEHTRDRDPLAWAATQNNLGNALATLGRRETGTARLEEAVNAHRAALQEHTRDRVPLNWATAQNNLGAALATLGERESNTARLQEAVNAYRAALQERTRDRVPLDWAMTQNNLGAVLATLGERETGTAWLQEAVHAYRAVLEERTRDRVPLDWAATQNNLGNALATLGQRETGTARLQEAVNAYRAALQEHTRDRVPLDWATAQNNLGAALATLGERETGTARLREAVTAFRAALQEHTRDHVPLDWAATQENLGKALHLVGTRDNNLACLQEALDAFTLCLAVTESAWPPEWVKTIRNNLAQTQAEITRRRAPD